MRPTLDQFLKGVPALVLGCEIKYVEGEYLNGYKLPGLFERKDVETGRLSIDPLISKIGWLTVTETEYIAGWYQSNVVRIY